MKQKATEFLSRKDLRQKIRRELSFGLFPKTLKGKIKFFSFFLLRHLACEEQRHFVHNSFNILVNEGFLRDQQGAHSLEVVQKFYEIIKEKPSRAIKEAQDLRTLCPPGVFTLKYQAVIMLLYEDSQTMEKYYHAVRVSKEPLWLFKFIISNSSFFDF